MLKPSDTTGESTGAIVLANAHQRGQSRPLRCELSMLQGEQSLRLDVTARTKL